MDEHALPRDNAGEQNMFKPDEATPLPSPIVESSPVSMQAATPVSESASSAVTTQPQSELPSSFTWTALEFVEHPKTAVWYMGLIVVAIVVALLVWLIAKDVFLVVVLMIGVVAFGIYAGRTPHRRTYTINEYGLDIAGRTYSFQEFGSFSVTADGPLLSIELLPLKRFSLYTTIYIEPADEEKVVGILSRHLPLTPPRNDLTDQFMRRIKF